MSTELMIVLAGASVSALAGGAVVAWWTGRNAPAADPAAEGRRELEVLELREAAAQSRREGLAAEQQLQAARQELAEARRHVGTLEDQVAAYLRQYAQAKNTLKGEIRLKNSLSTELAAATAQIRALEARVRELEMERTAITGTLRRISA